MAAHSVAKPAKLGRVTMPVYQVGPAVMFLPLEGPPAAWLACSLVTGG